MTSDTKTMDTEQVQTRTESATNNPIFAAQPATLGTTSGWAMRAVYLLSDYLAIVLGVVAADLLVRVWTVDLWAGINLLEVKCYGMLAIGLLMVAAIQRSYAAIPPRPVRQFRGWLLGAFAVWLTLVAMLVLLNVATWDLVAQMTCATVIAFFTAAFSRALCRIVFGKANWWGTRVIVVMTEGLPHHAYDDLRREPQWGLRPVGFVADGVTPTQHDRRRLYLGPISELESVAQAARTNRALVAVHTFDQHELSTLVTSAKSKIKHWIILPPLEGFPSLWLEECEAARLPAVTLTNRLALPNQARLKRVSDLTITIALGLLALPLFLILTLLIKSTSTGPVMFGHERVGINGRRFRAWKFRTMHPDADDLLQNYLDQHPELAAEWEANHKLKRDPRITWIGRILRATSLDELPQIFNVLRGDMSLVGPRPIVSAEIEKYSDCFHHYRKVLPGITGLWQVSGRNNTTYEERVDLDAYYVQNWSIWLDLYILACTVKVVILGEGAY